MPTLMRQFLPLCHLDDLPDGQSRGFDPQGIGQDTVLVVRQGESLHAWRDACPHHGTPMAWRRHAYLNGVRTFIVCHAHDALFEIDTGRCVRGPCVGEHLSAVPLQIHPDGSVSACLTRVAEHTEEDDEHH